MSDPKPSEPDSKLPVIRLIFVNDRPYRVWTGASFFRDEDLLRGFDPAHHFKLAELLESAAGSSDSETATLGIRTIYGLGVETFFALLFAVLQAPDAPTAWLLLYRPGDLEALIKRFERGEELPSRIVPRELGSWPDLARMLIPVTEFGATAAEPAVDRLGEFWARLAREYQDSKSRDEFNSLKHDLRAQSGSPVVFVGSNLIRGAENGSKFPVLGQRGKDVLVNIGSCSWSAQSLVASLRLVSSSIRNLLALLRHLHRIGSLGQLELELPTTDEFEAANRPGSQVLSSISLNANWNESLRIEPLDARGARQEYMAHSGPLRFRSE